MTNLPRATRASVENVDDASTRAGEELSSLGITAREHTTYEWGGYRYSNARDAIAAARRASR